MVFTLTLATAAVFGLGVLCGACVSAWIFGITLMVKHRR